MKKNEKYKSRLQFCICLFEFYEVLNSFYKYYKASTTTAEATHTTMFVHKIVHCNKNIPYNIAYITI